MSRGTTKNTGGSEIGEHMQSERTSKQDTRHGNEKQHKCAHRKHIEGSHMTEEHENYLSPSGSEVSTEYKKSREQWRVVETILQCLIMKRKRNTYRIQTGVAEMVSEQGSDNKHHSSKGSKLFWLIN